MGTLGAAGLHVPMTENFDVGKLNKLSGQNVEIVRSETEKWSILKNEELFEL